MGLLDKFAGLGQLDETQTQGLLAAASQMLQQSGPSRTPQGFGQIVGGGMEAYQGATMAAKRRKAEEDRAAMESKMYGMKMQGMESDLAAEAQKRDYEQRRDTHMSQFGGAAAPSGQPQQAPQLNSAPQASLPGMPQPMASPAAPAADTFQQKMARAAHYRAGGFHRDADAAEVEALKFREEYSLDLKNLQGADGKLRPYQVSKFGGVRDTGLGVAPDMVEVGLGNRKQFIDKNAVRDGQSYQMGMTPDQAADNANAAASRAQSDRHFNIRESRERKAPRGQVVQTEDGMMLVDPLSGQAQPVMSGGAPVRPKLKPLPASVVKTLTEARDNSATMDRLSTTFKDKFGGKGVFGLGADMSMNVKGNIGTDQESVAFWKDYRKNAELVERHAMFGASLTPGEQLSWRSADIAPGMSPAVIKTNLATRAALTKRMAAATADDTVDAGYNEPRVRAIAGRNAAAPEAKPGKTIKRTGMYGGRKVVEYTDGSTDYAN